MIAPVSPAPALPSSPPASPAPSDEPAGCGPTCRVFSSPAEAFAEVLASEPLVLGVGETHAQKSPGDVVSATHRFTEELLPLLRGRAKELILELWVSDGRCGTVERKVEEQQRPVTEGQAASNQSEFLALGRQARTLGINTRPLIPTCDEYRVIAAAGSEDILRMLEMIAKATERDVRHLFTPETSKSSLIVAYGGALHNDIEPRPGRELWSYGPAFKELTSNRYVELDLIVPELVGDDASWRAFRWYSAYDPARHGEETLLYNPGPGSFALIFPRSKPGAPPSGD